MKYTIKDLRKGKCAVRNDGSRNELEKILKLAFPHDTSTVLGFNSFYYKDNNGQGKWCTTDATTLPVQSAKDFLKSKYPKVMMVWNEDKPRPRVVVGKILGMYIGVYKVSSIDDIPEWPTLISWKHARDIDEKSVPEYTMKELVEKLGYNFKIKK